MTTELTGAGPDTLIAAASSRLDGSPLVLLLDIDGTLAPIAPRPELAVVPTATKQVLQRLAEIPDVEVVMITGRTAEDARRMVDIPGTWTIGNHGLELTTPGGETFTSTELRRFEPKVLEAQQMLGAIVRATPGAILENKRWSLTVHYRMAEPDLMPALFERSVAVAKQLGFRVTEGKMVVELRPDIAVDKGTAAVALAERLDATRDSASLFSAGDDRTDEDTFRALRELNPRAVTVRIKGAGDDVSVPTAAEFLLATTDDLRRVLDWLAARRGTARPG
jgi:trehalose-phosphatase